ncbi:MAG: SDR family NAD(P)-dependent oxidoreductase [Rubrivivax sp.]|nr:SDR family NAD(P)-dependent oxidoreductase [Rubrivivax sp.]
MSHPDSLPSALSIVTGASRGLGRALAALLLVRGHRVLTLQRQPDPGLDPGDGRLEQWACDLAAPEAAAARLEAWLGSVRAQYAAAPTLPLNLINNAAGLSQLAPVEDWSAEQMARDVRLGLEAPLLLSAVFLRATAGWPAPRKLLHISSGLGRRAMAGSTVYCAVKAGLDHMSRAIALEQAERPLGARSVSLAPGVIDTDMQLQLRSADPKVFAAQAQFEALKARGQLDTPQACALKLLNYLDRPDFGSQPVADVRDAA